MNETALRKIESITARADERVTAVLDAECAKVLKKCPTLVGFGEGMGMRWFVHRDGSHIYSNEDTRYEQRVAMHVRGEDPNPYAGKPHTLPNAAVAFMELFDWIESWHYLHCGYGYGDPGFAIEKEAE